MATWTCLHEDTEYKVSCEGGKVWADIYAARDHGEAMYLERLQAARRGECICPCYWKYCSLDHGNRIR